MGTWTHPARRQADCPPAAKTLWSPRNCWPKGQSYGLPRAAESVATVGVVLSLTDEPTRPAS